MPRRKSRKLSALQIAEQKQKESEEFDLTVQLIDASAKLRAALQPLSQLAAQGHGLSNAQLRHYLDAAVPATTTAETYVADAIGYLAHTEVRPPAMQAKSIFDVPELFEHVLGFLSIPELLKAQQVSRIWLQTVQTSVSLQRYLSLRPDTADGHFRTAFSHYHNSGHNFNADFSCHLRYDRYMWRAAGNKDNGIQLLARFGLGRDDVPEPPSISWRSMFVCQPKITSMKAYISCCNISPLSLGDGTFHGTVEPQDVSNVHGLTIGDLYDAAKKILADHANCPEASYIFHDWDTGRLTHSYVLFEGAVETSPSDPLRQKQTERLQFLERSRIKRERMEAFVRAKRAARRQDQELPDFETFKASYEEKAEDSDEEIDFDYILF